MKKKIFLLPALIAIVALAAFAKKSTSDPVLMTVDGRNVPLSEFEYLYNKNNSQQVQPLSLDEYVDLFVNYRLKVADALHAGLDTTANFNAEFGKYREDLAMPYLNDKDVAEQLVQEAYSRMLENVVASHIMVLPVGPDGRDGREVLDSIRALIVSGAETFEDAALKNSIDRQNSRSGGFLGSIVPGRFPYEFEIAAYATPEGEISQPVNSGFGWHIIRVDSRKPAPGDVHTSHILILNQQPDDMEKNKVLIDSLYDVAAAGADFADLARRFSQDPGSAQRGGDLGWYGPGRMVQPFDSISFALADGELSKPFATNYGYHIILKHESRPVAPLEQMRTSIEQAIQRDSRAQEPLNATLNRIAARTGSMVNESTLEAVKDMIAANGTDSLALVDLYKSKMPVYTVGKKTVSVGKVLTDAPIQAGFDPAYTAGIVENNIREAYRKDLLELAFEELEATNTEYRNLLNEYRDGILLFEVSNRNVWDKASKDIEGLEEYFRAHRDNYSWDKPRFKGYVVFATNEEILDQAKAYADSIASANLPQEEFVKEMRTRFGRDIKIERVIAAQGENPITDYLGFGAEKPEVKSQRWPVYFAYDGKVIDQPEESADVRSAVITDYQTMLEHQWLEKLKKQYKVKINQKVLQQVK